MKPCIAPIAALFVSLAAASGTYAEGLGQHPAVFAPRALPAVNASTFIVGHPASPTTRGRHANVDHPAVRAVRAAAGIDPNIFLVQPPASTSWVATPVLHRPIALK